MSDLNDKFAKLLGRQPSDKEIQTLYKVRDALELKNNDALWLVLMALQYYQWQYEEMPERIKKSTKEVLEGVKSAANKVIEESTETARAELAKAISETAQKVAHQTATTNMWQWAAASIAIAFLCLGMLGWGMYKKGDEAGYKAGYYQGYMAARDEKARASWANTPEGRLAYRFAEIGELQRLARCDGKGWKITHIDATNNDICLPLPVEGVPYGWRLP